MHTYICNEEAFFDTPNFYFYLIRTSIHKQGKITKAAQKRVFLDDLS